MLVFGGKTRGSSHAVNGIPCQDAFRCGRTGSGEIIVAVADGLGSAEYSEKGAEIAVNSAVDRIELLFIEDAVYGIPRAALMKNREIMKEAFSAAREALEAYAHEHKCPLKKLACTLIVAFTYYGYVTTGHIGDGAVAAQMKGEIGIISSPGDSEYINEVTPLTSGEVGKNLRINENIPDVDIFAIFTDGCQRAFLERKNGNYIPFEPFFRPFFSYAKGVSDEKEASNEVSRFLDSEMMEKNSDDDKTLVIAVLDRETPDI